MPPGQSLPGPSQAATIRTAVKITAQFSRPRALTPTGYSASSGYVDARPCSRGPEALRAAALCAVTEQKRCYEPHVPTPAPRWTSAQPCSSGQVPARPAARPSPPSTSRSSSARAGLWGHTVQTVLRTEGPLVTKVLPTPIGASAPAPGRLLPPLPPCRPGRGSRCQASGSRPPRAQCLLGGLCWQGRSRRKWRLVASLGTALL